MSGYPSDADAARAVEIAYWAGRKLMFEGAALRLRLRRVGCVRGGA